MLLRRRACPRTQDHHPQLHDLTLGFLNVERLGHSSHASTMQPPHPVQIDWSRLRCLSLNSCAGMSRLLWRLASIDINLMEFVLRNEYNRQEHTPSFDAALQYFLATQPGLELLSIMVSSTNSSSIFRTINLLHLENQPANKALKVLVLDGRHEARDGASHDPVPQSTAQLSQIVKHYPNLLELACNIPFPVSRRCPKASIPTRSNQRPARHHKPLSLPPLLPIHPPPHAPPPQQPLQVPPALRIRRRLTRRLHPRQDPPHRKPRPVLPNPMPVSRRSFRSPLRPLPLLLLLLLAPHPLKTAPLPPLHRPLDAA